MGNDEVDDKPEKPDDGVKVIPTRIHEAPLQQAINSIYKSVRAGNDLTLERQEKKAEKTRESIENDGREKFYALRNKWSSWIIFWISALICFNAALTVLVGLGALDFQNYEWFITVVTVETFLQIVGMGYIAVRFLFQD